MKLRKTIDGEYTLKERDADGRETKDAHYKFVKIRERPRSFTQSSKLGWSRDVKDKLKKS